MMLNARAVRARAHQLAVVREAQEAEDDDGEHRRVDDLDREQRAGERDAGQRARGPQRQKMMPVKRPMNTGAPREVLRHALLQADRLGDAVGAGQGEHRRGEHAGAEQADRRRARSAAEPATGSSACAASAASSTAMPWWNSAAAVAIMIVTRDERSRRPSRRPHRCARTRSPRAALPSRRRTTAGRAACTA